MSTVYLMEDDRWAQELQVSLDPESVIAHPDQQQFIRDAAESDVREAEYDNRHDADYQAQTVEDRIEELTTEFRKAWRIATTEDLRWLAQNPGRWQAGDDEAAVNVILAEVA